MTHPLRLNVALEDIAKVLHTLGKQHMKVIIHNYLQADDKLLCTSS